MILPINLLKRHTLRELDPAQRLQACFRAGVDAKVAVAESDLYASKITTVIASNEKFARRIVLVRRQWKSEDGIVKVRNRTLI